LFDVEFHERMRCHEARCFGPEIADATQLRADRHAPRIGRGMRLREIQATGMHEAAHHVGLEPRALLVGEDGHAERACRRDAGIAERLDHLETGDDAVVAVVATARPDRVDMGSGEDGGTRAPSGRHAEDVADGVDPDLEFEVAHPGDDKIPALAILVG
jgi:hypothetical protein